MAEVTILIPTFNRKKLLFDAIETACAQTLQDIEIVVYDDGSTDKTEKRMAKIKDPRIRYIQSDEHHGVAYARNKLLEACETKYGCWLDSDDFANIYRVELLLQVMKRYDAPFVRSAYSIFKGDNAERWKREPELLFSKRHAVATGLFRMDCVPKYDDRIDSHGEDVVWELEMVAKHGTGICIGAALYDVRRGKHKRVSKFQNSVHGKSKWRRQPEIKERFLKSEKARVPLHAKWTAAVKKQGLNPRVRVEYIPSEMINYPFDVKKHPEFRLSCQDANSCSSKRIKDWPKVEYPARTC